MPYTRSFLFILFSVLVLLGCSPEEDHQWSQDWDHISQVQIDSMNLFLNPADNNVSNIHYIQLLPDNRLAVLDTKEKMVKIYEPNGTLDATVGQEGKGPGEFITPRGLHVNNTTINIIDVSLQRINQFDLDGNFIQNYKIKRKTSFFGSVATGDSMEYILLPMVIMADL